MMTQTIRNSLLLIIVSFIISGKMFATAQYGDILIIDKDTAWINSNPLEDYFEQKGSRSIAGIEMTGGCTALWRGYVATWLLEKDKLYLIRLQTEYCGDNPTEINIATEFGSNNVLASWFNRTIVMPKGELLQYVHMGYMSIYEEEVYYTFKNGKLSNTKNEKYLVKEKDLVFPGEHFLADTIKTIILKSIDSATRAKFSADSSCSISFLFNEKGELFKIGIGYGYSLRDPANEMEKILLGNAIFLLKGFPRLMKVVHKDYNPPLVTLFFNGHCLKYPYDRKYGCNDE